MKAESIEQIREHLARGGRVVAHHVIEDGYDEKISEVYGVASGGTIVIEYTDQKWVDFNSGMVDHWELLPIEKSEKRPEWFRDSQKERMQRIRQSLLFGHYPSLDDLRDWWQATTGERIEWGRRCERCECSGEVTVRKIMKANCPKCNASGYTVRPTWMETV